MHFTFGEQLAAVIKTVAALVVTSFAVAALLEFGPVKAAVLLAYALAVFLAFGYAIGRSLRPRTAAPASADDESSD
jgi:hypothetical protein